MRTQTGIEPEQELESAVAHDAISDWAEQIHLHYEMHQGGFISAEETLGDALILYSEIASSPMWNHAAWLGRINGGFGDFVDHARLALGRRQRQPVLYLPIDPEQSEATERLLSSRGFERFDQEAWMSCFHPDNHSVGQAPELKICEAATEHEIATFINVFYAAYHLKDPAYACILKRAALGYHSTAAERRVRHFIAYAGPTPVSVATLIQSNGDAGIYNVGTNPGSRNRGYGRGLVQHLMREATERGHCRIFLQTTAGSAAERLYQKLGFATQFTRVGYRLKDWRTPFGDSAIASRVHFLHSIRGFAIDRTAPAGNPEETHASVRIEPSGSFADCLSTIARRCQMSAEAAVAAAWAVLLSRYSGEETVSFGLRLGSTEHLRGSIEQSYCITVPTEARLLEWGPTLEQILSLPRNNASDSTPAATPAHNGAATTYETLLTIAPDASENGEFQANRAELELRLRNDWRTAEVIYSRALFSEPLVRQLAGHLFRLVESMAADPQQNLSAVDMLTPSERERLLVEWNRPSRHARSDGHFLSDGAADLATDPKRMQPCPSVRTLFERQVERTPEAMALIGPAGHSSSEPMEELTYWQLNRRANQLANYLRSVGVGADSFVGLCFDRSVEMIVALLAVMKAGGAAVPLDPASPPDRTAFTLRDTRMPVLLTAQPFLSRIPSSETTILCTDTVWETIACQDATNPPATHPSDSIAYVIYTSGSTGMPKGVLIGNEALARHCWDAAKHYELREGDRVLQFASFTFDAAFEQIFSPLISGAAVVMRGPEIWSPSEFAQRLFDYELSVVDLPTAYWHQLSQEWARSPGLISNHRLRLVIVGGEAMLPQTVQIWRQTPLKDVRLINAYGPTEATITATTYDVPQFDPLEGLAPRIPIGQARGGRRLYVLDRWKKPVAIGLAGELHIGGPLLARGYLNRPELTKQKFIPDPFGGEGARLYCTGDWVRYRPDGNLEFLGRIDDQVKLRGFRVELGEIEALLAQHAEVKQAAVVLREDSAQDKRLIAYVAPKAFHSSTAKDLRCFLRHKLPEYMIPSDFVLLETLPLTVNGKVDRRALPAPVLKTSHQEWVVKGPSRPLELRLQLLFEKVLNRRPIGVDVSFFELGGNSLQALEALVGIEKITAKTLPLDTLYQTSTIEGLASILEEPPASPERSCLVPLQAGGARPPFFLIHTTPGDVLGYGNLIYHLNPDQPCYGFQSLGLCDPELCHCRITDMAAHYVEILRSVQPRGPYYLGGWCYGGIVALEMARALLATGEQVALLALLETIAPAPGWIMPSYYIRRAARLLRMSPREWRAYLKAKAIYYRHATTETRLHPMSKATPDTGASAEDHSRIIAQLERVYKTNMKALRRHRSRFYPGRVTLFNAAEPDPAIIRDPYYGWSGLAAEIEVHTVPGDHDTTLAEPHVAALAQELERCLRRAQNRSKASRQSQPSMSGHE